MTAGVERILLIKPSALGDVVLALPALTWLRRRYPDATVDWLIRPEYAPLLEGHPHLNDVVLFDRRRLGRFWPLGPWSRGMRQLLGRLRQARYDVVYDLQGLLRSALLACWTGTPRRVGLEQAREGARWLYTERFGGREVSRHVIEQYLSVVRRQDGPVAPAEVTFVFPEHREAREQVQVRLHDSGLTPGRYVVLVPGSAHASKCWPVERYRVLLTRLTGECGLKVLLVGGAAERALGDDLVADQPRGTVVDWVGRTSLPELRWTLAWARLVISNDTGPGHLAAALGRPLVMMFSWSNPARIYPYGRPECMVAVEPFERPDTIRSEAPEHQVDRLRVEDVWAVVLDQLERFRDSTTTVDGDTTPAPSC